MLNPDRVGFLVGVDPPDVDKVYLLTRYASVDHWAATRDMAKSGGNGPDGERFRQAVKFGQSIILDTWVIFLEERIASNGPYFMPGLNENYGQIRNEE